MAANGIDESLRDDFVRHAVNFDDDDNQYLKKAEIEAAAAAWVHDDSGESDEESEESVESDEAGDDTEASEESEADEAVEESSEETAAEVVRMLRRKLQMRHLMTRFVQSVALQILQVQLLVNPVDSLSD